MTGEEDANVLINIFACVIGAIGALLYIGYLAYKIGAPPLIIITICCMLPMIYAFYDDLRHDREVARMQSGHERK